MEISEILKRILSKYENEINSYQFEDVYSELKNGKDIATFTEMMLSVDIDPAKHLKYIPPRYLYDSKIEKYNIPNDTMSIGDSAFASCDRLMSITIPDSVTSIGDYAFGYCSGLTSVTIGNGVTTIENHAFSYCSRLTSITIGNGVESIGAWAFDSCSNLTSITIGNGVKSIGNFAFQYCSELKDITYRGTVEQWKKIEKEERDFSEIKIHCSDGEA